MKLKGLDLKRSDIKCKLVLAVADFGDWVLQQVGFYRGLKLSIKMNLNPTSFSALGFIYAKRQGSFVAELEG